MEGLAVIAALVAVAAGVYTYKLSEAVKALTARVKALEVAKVVEAPLVGFGPSES